MDDKLSGLLGIAHRARKVIYGDVAFEALGNSRASLLLISEGASERTHEKLVNRAKYYGVDYEVISDVLLNQATGNSNKKYLVIIDRGFSKGILDICRKR